MKIVLAVEPIRPPLTGIGRYTWELATRLPQKLEPGEVTYIANGEWVTLESLRKTPIIIKRKKKKLLSRAKSIPRRIMHLPVISHAYQYLSQYLNSLRLHRTDYDLYHGPNYYVPKINKPSVVTIHDLSTIIYPNWHPGARVRRINKFLPKAINNASLVITDSNAIREEVIHEFKIPEEKVIAIPLGVDPSFMPRSEDVLLPFLATYGLTPNGYSLCVATIEPRKNIDRLINAYRSLPKSLLKSFPLVIIGEPGWKSDELHKNLNQAIGEGWLHYLGFVPTDHLPLFYSGASLFVYPSLYEGFGLPIAEALASAVPVITSNCSSMPEVAKGSAYLINPTETESIREGIISCLEDEARRSKMKEAGLLRAKELNWDTCVDLTLNAYKLVLKRV